MDTKKAFNLFKTLEVSKADIISTLHEMNILVDDNLQLLPHATIGEMERVILEAIQTLWLRHKFLREHHKKEKDYLLQNQARWTLSLLSSDDLRICTKLFLEDYAEGESFTAKIAPLAKALLINRSVAVMTLRKLETGQIIETRSRGRRGTWIRILNPHLRAKLKEVNHANSSQDAATS